MAEHSSVPKQLIYGDGRFNDAGLDRFVKAVKLPECGVSYAVVAIMGPQSTGKSTLLNNLFCTNFAMMDSSQRRSQTTKGIWMAKAPNMEPLTIIMDIEGNDGQERGEDVTFEKQSALFALALADAVFINMRHDDMGRQNAANKPLLTTVFEIWENVTKPVDRQNAALRDFFTVAVFTLSNFKLQKVDFKNEVEKLRDQLSNSIAPGGLAGDSQERVPGSGFSLGAQNIWKVIKGNNDLNLPAHKVMVATVRCEEISKEKFCHLCEDKDWSKLKVAAQSGSVPDFGTKLSSILNIHLLEYDNEAMYFDDGVRERIREKLKLNMLQRVHPTYAALLKHHQRHAMEGFITQLETALGGGQGFASSVRDCMESCMLQFDQNCADDVPQQATDWNPEEVRDQLKRDIEAHSSSLRREKLSEIRKRCEKNLSDAIEGALIDTILLEASNGADSWRLIRELVQKETGICISECDSAVSGFELDESSCQVLRQDIQEFARDVVKKKVTQEAARVLAHMKDRFTSGFSQDGNLMPRSWIVGLDIDRINHDARSACLKILSAMAVIRLEESPDDSIENLLSSLMDHLALESSTHPLNSTQWNEVAPADTILKPVECWSLWKQFIKDTKYVIAHATTVQEANREIEIAEAIAERARVDAVRAVERAQAASEEARAEANAASIRALETANAARLEAVEVAYRAEAALAQRQELKYLRKLV